MAPDEWYKYQVFAVELNSPLGFMTWTVLLTTKTSVWFVSCLCTAAASERGIFSITADLFRPVPAALAPAFCVKYTSSFTVYLPLCQLLNA